jgi:cathepsin H
MENRLIVALIAVAFILLLTLTFVFDIKKQMKSIQGIVFSIPTNLNSNHAYDEEEELMFHDWMKRFSKEYDSVTQKRERFQVFKHNLNLIKKHNQARLKGIPTHELGLTTFADWTEDEFFSHFQFQKKSHQCWTASDKQEMIQRQNTLKTRSEITNELLLPKAIDWRQLGVVSPVKNQKSCGSCWAFSATGALEAHFTKKHGKPISLSEQQLLDCSYSYGNFGCNGGFPARAFEYIRKAGGLETEENYPYEISSNGSVACRFRRSTSAVRVRRVVNITEYDEHELEAAVGLEGPVAVAFVVKGDFRLYSGGVYTTEECGNPKPDDLTHAVLVVGYGVTYEGQKYWIVKNSWSENWGVRGYFLMERGTFDLCLAL